MKTITLIIASIILISTASVHAGPQRDEWLQLCVQAEELFESGEYEAATQVAKKALELGEKEFSSDSPRLFHNLCGLAHCYFALEQYDLAEPLYIRALALWEKSVGTPYGDRLSTILHKCTYNLGNIYLEQGNYGLAEDVFKFTLSAQEKALGSDHQLVAVSLMQIALACAKQRKYDEAISLYERALAIREKHIGSDHPNLIVSLDVLKVLYRQTGQLEKAEKMEKRIEKIQNTKR